MEELFLTLTSNSSRKSYPNNSSSNFTVELPQLIDFTHGGGSWMVGLAQVHLSDVGKVKDLDNIYFEYEKEKLLVRKKLELTDQSFYWDIEGTIISGDILDHLFVKLKKGFMIHVYLPDNSHRYFLNNEQEFKNFAIVLPEYSPLEISIKLSQIMSDLTRVDLNPNTYFEDLKKEIIVTKATVIRNELTVPKDMFVRFSTNLVNLLGLTQEIFDEGRYTLQPYNYTELKRLDAIHVYSDIVRSQIVGHTFAPLLRSIPSDSSYLSLNPIFYLPLARQSFQSIEIDISSDKGLSLDIGGTTTIVLHFKKKK